MIARAPIRAAVAALALGLAVAACSRSSGSGAAPAGSVSSSGSAPAAVQGGAPCNLDGTWLAVAYSCKGEAKVPTAPFKRWSLVIQGDGAKFIEKDSTPLPTCTQTEDWNAACSSDATLLTLTAAGKTTCDPEGCMSKGGDPGATYCNLTPEPMKFSVSERGPTSFVVTSIEPFPIPACTSRGKSNPMTIWWQKS